MKKALLLCFVLVFTNLLVAQQSVSINGPSTVEVGVPYNYTFQFNPVYPEKNGVLADSYVITEWIVSTGTNGSSAGITGYIGTPSNQSSYYYDDTYNNSNPKTIPIQWGNGTFLSSDNITVKVSGIYRKSSTGENIGYFNYQPQATKSVTVERLVAPVITGASTVVGCNQTNQTYTFTNSTNSNQRLWSVTGGATIVGSATGTSVTVTPPLSGNFSVNCTVKRSGANTNYSVTGSKTVSRTLFSTSATISGNETLCTNGTYTVSGLEAGLSVVSWSATNASIATLGNTTGASTTLTKVAQGTVTLTATITNTCNETRTITKDIIVGSPMPLIDNFTCVSESAPCFLNTTANNNYLTFNLSAPIGSYTPLTADWQWEKISGNFFLLENGQYNSATATGRQGNIYLTGANPTDNPLKFRCRVKNACGWGNWRNYEWNDGTTTPVVVPPAPEKYFMVYPNPAVTATGISLVDVNIKPESTPTVAELYSISGVLQYTSYFNNYSSSFYVGNLSSNSTYYIIIRFSNGSTEGHTLYKN